MNNKLDYRKIPTGMYCRAGQEFCPYFTYEDHDAGYGVQTYAYCKLLEKGDWEDDMGLLWDCVKACGIKDVFCECEKLEVAELYPDYASYGLRCPVCQVGLAVESILPENLLNKLDVWVNLCCMMYDLKTDKYVEKLVSIGHELASEVNEYIPCKFNEELFRSVLDKHVKFL